MNVTVDKFGRVVIPKEVRDELALEEGVSLKVEISGGAVLLKPEHQPPLLKKEGVLAFCGEPETEIKNAISRDRLKRIRKAGKLGR